METWVYAEDRPLMVARHERLLAGHAQTTEFRLVTKTGAVRWLRDYGRPIWNPEQTRVVRLYGAVQDVTAQKDLEQRLQTYTTNLETLVDQKVRELELERAKLIQAGKLASLGEMATGVAHELNQPLTALQFEADYLQTLARRAMAAGETALRVRKSITSRSCGRSPTAPPWRQASAGTVRDRPEREVVYLQTLNLKTTALMDVAQNIAGDIARARRIIDHLRAFGRVSTAGVAPLDINRPIADAFILTEQRLRQHNVEIGRDLTADLPPVLANAHKLEQVFLNLISNAEYALRDMPRRCGYQKTLKITSYVADTQVCVQVGDNGVGISAEHQARLFEPFFTTKPIGEGAGLGLSISYGIIAEFGGSITCTSAENEGPVFTICLPVVTRLPAEAEA